MGGSSASTNTIKRYDGKGSGSRCQYKKRPGFNQDAIKRVSFKIV